MAPLQKISSTHLWTRLEIPDKRQFCIKTEAWFLQFSYFRSLERMLIINKRVKRFAVYFTIAFCINQFLFLIDEGYNDLRWMKSAGNWIVFYNLWLFFPSLYAHGRSIRVTFLQREGSNSDWFARRSPSATCRCFRNYPVCCLMVELYFIPNQRALAMASPVLPFYSFGKWCRTHQFAGAPLRLKEMDNRCPATLSAPTISITYCSILWSHTWLSTQNLPDIPLDFLYYRQYKIGAAFPAVYNTTNGRQQEPRQCAKQTIKFLYFRIRRQKSCMLRFISAGILTSRGSQ